MALLGFPLLLISFAIYNIVAFLMPGVSWAGAFVTLHLVSAADVTLTAGDLLIALSLLLLFGEIAKWTRIGGRSVIDHLLSLVLFVVMLIEFLILPQAATPTFFLLLLLSFVDAVGGFTVAIRSAQRGVTIEDERAAA